MEQVAFALIAVTLALLVHRLAFGALGHRQPPMQAAANPAADISSLIVIKSGKNWQMSIAYRRGRVEPGLH
jgi:hypothetical protein